MRRHRLDQAVYFVERTASEVLKGLTPREEKVLRLRFGLMTDVRAHWKKSDVSSALRASEFVRLKQKPCVRCAIRVAAKAERLH